MELTLGDEYIKNERFSYSNVHKIQRVQCSYFLNKWGPIDLVLIPCMNKPRFPFETDLKSRRHKSRCELEMNGTALESIHIFSRVEY
jgi:hypothetical protein